MSYQQKLFLAKQFRKQQTKTEQIIWRELRRKKLMGLKFKRQYVTLGYIIDFYCPKLKLAIEIDGGIHNSKKELDRLREKIIKARNIKFIRFSNQEIKTNLGLVIRKLKYIINKNIS